MNAPARIPNQWPDNICSGDIRYAPASNYDGFYLADVQHGIPTFGAVCDTSPSTIRGQHVRIFNYPAQTEAIAAQLVHRWNCHASLLEALTEARVQVEILQGRLGIEDNGSGTLSIIDAALSKAGASRSESALRTIREAEEAS